MRNHRGYSLVELLVTMSVSTVLLGLATGVIHRTMRAESISQDRADLHRVALRLSTALRQDIHRASAALPLDADNDQPKLELEIPGGSKILYSVEERQSAASTNGRLRSNVPRSFRLPRESAHSLC